MLIKQLCLMLIALLVSGVAFAAGKSDLKITVTKSGATVMVDHVIKDGKVLVSVEDAGKKPLFGLTTADFSVTESGRKGIITSVQSFSENLDVPRHIVLLLDNSYSMYERKAIKAVLAGVGELLKNVRPIDDVQIVVFDNNKTVEIGGRKLHVQTFGSNKPAELQEFAAKAYRTEGLTGATTIYESLLAGLDLINKMPTTEPRFMVVFSDGEDLNSAFKKDDVFMMAKGIDRFKVYAIDYMERPATDKFLTKLATDNSGQVWKATSETNLVPIFQEVASKMMHYYVVNYQFPLKGTLTVSPTDLTMAEVKTIGSAPLPTGLNHKALILRPVVDTAYGITRWKAVVSNTKGSIAERAGEGAPAPEVNIDLPITDLQTLAASGELAVKMTVEDRIGQSLALAAAPLKVKLVQTQASLVVSPADLTIDEVNAMGAAVPTISINAAALTLLPAVGSVSWIARWKAVVSNAKGSVAELSGEGAPAAELKIQLPTTDLQAIAANGDLSVKMILFNLNGQSLEVSAPPVKVKLVQTRANLVITPASLKIEEIKTIDVSPMLGHIYFTKGAGEILPRYVRFNGPGETAGFDEQKFTGTLEKYYQDLNIIGKRLVEKPDARITLVGCNDNTGKEKGNKKLSTKRAEAVRDYLKTIWNIAPERMTIEVRNLPTKPSSIQLKEGQAENRRVEIVSLDPAILAPIRSTYLASRIDATTLTMRSDVAAPHGVASWNITAANASGTLADLAGKGAPGKEIPIQLNTGNLMALASGGDIKIKMVLQDTKGQIMVLSPEPVKVDFIQTTQRLAQKQNLRVQEKYALVLFDFDKESIDKPNQEIINRIVARIKTLPQATVEIVGHTDNIGKEKYNLKLSERRALAVNKLLAAGFGEALGDRIRYSGVGQNSPLFDNLSPEARMFNRTVTITLEYLSAE